MVFTNTRKQDRGSSHQRLGLSANPLNCYNENSFVAKRNVDPPARNLGDGAGSSATSLPYISRVSLG